MRPQRAAPGFVAPKSRVPRGAIRWHAYDRQNVEAAKLILEEPAKYGGWDALPLLWARRVMASQTGNRTR